jgi:glycine cleavage system H lipoate-binding protein
VKTAATVYMPILGTVESVNEQLVDEPETLTGESAEDEGWLMNLEIENADNVDSMMSEE